MSMPFPHIFTIYAKQNSNILCLIHHIINILWIKGIPCQAITPGKGYLFTGVKKKHPERKRGDSSFRVLHAIIISGFFKKVLRSVTENYGKLRTFSNSFSASP